MSDIVSILAKVTFATFRAPRGPEERKRLYITCIWTGATVFTSALLFLFFIERIDYSLRGIGYELAPYALFIAFACLGVGLLLLSSYILLLFLEDGTVGGRAEKAPSVTSLGGAPGEAGDPKPTLYEQFVANLCDRLLGEIDAQGRKASLNLIAGALTAAGGLAILGWLAWDTSRRSAPVTPMLYWGQFAAKLALSISANAFSLFFLSTYRRTLTEIKYFQNELTNVEMKLISLLHASANKFTDTQKRIVLELSQTERNFLLKKGETTADVQIKALDTEDNAAVSALLAQVLQLGAVAGASRAASARPRASSKVPV